ncbi:hypothetical protein M0805_005406 [Coniferiporia weirii]|nr:hypothetical protein M0805_005406 [Coniferiporia weirii]
MLVSAPHHLSLRFPMAVLSPHTSPAHSHRPHPRSSSDAALRPLADADLDPDPSASTDADVYARPHSPVKHHPDGHPGSRPPLRNNLDLEPNPFEQSFSVTSNSPPTLSSIRNDGASRVPSDKRSSSAASSTTHGSGHSRKTSLNNVSNSDAHKPILPPLASITSPSDPSYAWSFSAAGLTNSLRSGPLSPAMLAGPQTQPPVSVAQPASSVAALAASAASVHPPLFGFDASGTFRTGLTPSTGLTPLVGGPVSFPPPSPNTAAFLAMVNSGSAVSSAAATITPNTLNALTGVLQQHTASQQQQANANGSGAPNSSTNTSQQATSLAPSQMSVNGYSSNSSATHRYALTNAYATAHSQPDNSNDVNYENSASAANHAANGLFLLSQAHQELTKREEAQKQSMAQSGVNGITNGAGTHDVDQSGTKRGSKRKNDNASVSSGTSTKAVSTKRTRATSSTAANTRGSGTRRGSTAASSTHDFDDDMMDEDDDSEDDGAQQSSLQSTGGNKGGQKKFETEEEKRKNFLERNRQAALKCRQRKKAWLAQLQAKVEFLQNENERLTSALVSSREEISRLSQLVGGAGVGLPMNASGMGVGVPLNGMGMGAVQQQQQVHSGHHTSYMVHQQPHHPVSVPVNLTQGSSAPSPPMANKGTPLQQHQQPQQQSPHSPASEGRSSRSSVRDVRDARDYNSGRDASNGRDYVRDVREREMNGHMHGHVPQVVAVNGRGYGY